MSLAKISIIRPIFMTCVTILIMVVGWTSFRSMSVDLFPDVSIPVVTVQSIYAGAGPAEIETLVSKPIEDEVSSISGIKRLSSKSLEGMSQVIVEFNSDVNATYAEQQVRDKVNIAKSKLPDEVEDPIIKKFDPADSPILMLALYAEAVSDAQLYDIADQFVKPRLEQVNNVGAIDIIGGRKREIHVLLDRNKLKEREISVSQVVNQLSASGQNIPSGKVNKGEQELVFRGLGEFKNVNEVADTLVNLYGNEVPTRVAELGTVKDTLEDEKSRGFVDGKKAIILQVYRQAGSNTIEVADNILKQVAKVQPELDSIAGSPTLKVVNNSSTRIKDNVFDVYETIVIGIILTVITVFFFLGSGRSTFITALSLPVSLIGAFILLKLFNFSINLVSLLALVLAVGLLIDDAIVVIENIYRRMELGESAKVAADKGTAEIQMAVVAITLVVMAVFVPVAMMSGIIGQFLKQFGLTVAFSMAISLFVALTLIPMLAAYFGGSGHHGHADDKNKKASFYDLTLGRMVKSFDRFQTWLENFYEKILNISLKHTFLTLVLTVIVFFGSIFTVTKVPFEFIPDDDSGEIMVSLELPTGSNLDSTNKIAEEVNTLINQNPEIDFTFYFAGNMYGEANKSNIIVKLKQERDVTSVEFRDRLRQQLVPYQQTANPVVTKFDTTGGMQGQPIMLNIVSTDPQALEEYAMKILDKMKADKRLVDVDTNYRTGKPELQIDLRKQAAREYGVLTGMLGRELRGQVEGFVAAKYREGGNEYDVRVRLQENQRDLKEEYNKVYIPNINGKLVRLSDIADGNLTTGPASIERQDRGRYIQLTAGIAPGVGLSDAVNDLVATMTTGEMKMPSNVRYSFAGDAENMQELGASAIAAVLFGVLLIYLILSSLYESFITPITILVALPLALSGAFLALFITGKSLNMFAILGLFMLLGVAGKNGILLVDFTKQMMDAGKSRTEALILAGKTRLRPILMTSFALVAGVVPIAIGLNAASRTRTSMGVGIIGGVIVSTVLTLIVVPALFTYVDRFRVWANKLGAKLTGSSTEEGSSLTAQDSQSKVAAVKKEDHIELT